MVNFEYEKIYNSKFSIKYKVASIKRIKLRK